MSIIELGALGEFLGSIGVIATLIYLAIQIRANTRATKGNASFQATHSWAESCQRLSELPGELFAPFTTMFKADKTAQDMTPEEYERLRYTFRAIFQKLEGQYYLFKYGLLEPQVWETRSSIGSGMVQGNPLLREWWESDTNPTNYSPEFVNAINDAEPIDAAKLARQPGETS